MPRIFNTIRQRLLKENRLTRYLVYAVGEIVLVVIGILIALQINNNNDLRKARIRELQYLRNIKADLEANLVKVNDIIALRAKSMEAAQRVIAKINGEPIEDWKAFSNDRIAVYVWTPYYPTNFTFQEMMSSGSLGQLTNDSVKTALLVLESLFKQAKAEEEHYRFDAEELLYKPVYELMDLEPTLNIHMGEDVLMRQEDFATYFADKRVKNGFLMAVLELSTMNRQLEEVRRVSEGLIGMIDRELTKDQH
jgi:hypothetical protein